MPTTAKTWWTSDQHFGHKNIIKYCERPFATVEEMDFTMITNWNAVVGLDDTVMCVGDFSFRDRNATQKIIESLNGTKVLILGNHDEHHTKTWWKDVGFDDVMTEGSAYLDSLLCMAEVKHVPQFEGPYDIQIHGHVHEHYKIKCYKANNRILVNVGVDQWNFTPITTDLLVEAISIYRAQLLH